MTLSPSGQPPHPADSGRQAQGPGQRLIALSATFGGIALVSSAVWLLIIEAVARLLRPADSSAFPAYRGDVTPFQQAALTRMTAIVIVTFLAIVALAIVAIFLGRRARRQSGNDAALASAGKMGHGLSDRQPWLAWDSSWHSA